jgi:hypothetical protein
METIVNLVEAFMPVSWLDWTVPVATFFVLTIVLGFVCARLIPPLQRVMASLATSLGQRAFPAPSKFEHNKFALLRASFGLIILLRGLACS